MRWLVIGALVLALVAAACTSSTPEGSPANGGVFDGEQNAPEFPAGLDWLNATQPVTLADLEDQVALVYFWTSSCLSCRETIDDVERLRAEHPDEVVAVGVHSPKFPHEAKSETLETFLSRYGIDHPQANDRVLTAWNEWGIRAWPTVAVIDPEGTVVTGHTGGDVYAALQSTVERLTGEYADTIDPTVRIFPTGLEPLPPTVLSFPGAVLADPAGGRLFIADTGHQRVVVADLDTGEVRLVIGSGEPGNADGPAETASFAEPRGMALDPAGTTLYVADTGNHLIRAVALDTATVGTVAGTGGRGGFPPEGGRADRTALNAPWDLVFRGDVLYISMAGFNQVWRWDLTEDTIEPFAGTGQEGADDGPRTDALLARPAGLATGEDGRLFFADAESSTIRWVGGDEVGSLAGGGGLFAFGDEDGIGTAARFQRPAGLAVAGGALLVADTFNSKLKRVDLATGETLTVVGGEGWRDGTDPRFTTPEGIDAAAGLLYVADTGNHSVRVVDPVGGETTTFVLKGIERLAADSGDAEFEGRHVLLDPVEVGAGPGRVVLDVTYPPGYKANSLAPSRFEWKPEGNVVTLAPTAERSVTEPTFPMTIEATFTEGEGSIRAELWLVYCEATTESICLFDRGRIDVPLEVTADGPDTVEVGYQVILPEGL